MTDRQDSSITIIRSRINDDIGVSIQKRGYNIYKFYLGNDSFFLRLLRRVWLKINLPFKKIWFDKKILEDKSKQIVIFDSLLTESYIKWILKHKPDADIAVWYWNIVKNTISPKILKKYNCVLWSFSRVDCENYNLKFNPPPYFFEYKYSQNQIKYDITFVGKNKGRLDEILKWKDIFSKLGLSTKFCITPNHKFDFNKEYTSSMSYSEAMDISSQGKAIFDFIEIDNSGQSMRVMESLFLNKKLITNNKLIVDYDFYDPKNIFILNVDTIENIVEFMKNTYITVNKELLKKYDFDYFVRRFWSDENNVWWKKEND